MAIGNIHVFFTARYISYLERQGFLEQMMPDEFSRSFNIQQMQLTDLSPRLMEQEAEINAICKILKTTSRYHIATGVGKAGHIAHKFADTLSSIGVPCFYFDATAALHGDIGRLKFAESCTVFSKSGHTLEVIKAIDFLPTSIEKIAITADAGSSLAVRCDHVIELHVLREGNHLNLPPMASTLQMELVANCLIAEVMFQRKTSLSEYKTYHPGGAIGRKLIDM